MTYLKVFRGKVLKGENYYYIMKPESLKLSVNYECSLFVYNDLSFYRNSILD